MKSIAVTEAKEHFADLAGSWYLDLITGERSWSDQVFRIFRIEREAFDGTTAIFYRCVHPDEREQVRQATDAAINDGKTYSIDYRIVLSDGEERIVHEQAEVEFDDSGKPVFLHGIVQDFTERKRTENALRQSEARYRELFDESPVAIWEEDWSAIKQMLDDLARSGVKDWRGYFDNHRDQLKTAYGLAKILEISLATIRLYKEESKEDLLGRSVAEIVIEEEFDAFLEIVLSFLAGQMTVDIEAKDVAGDGSEIIVRRRVVIPLKYHDDWSRVIYAIEDITERKRAEELSVRFGRIIERSVNEVYVFDAETLKFIQVNQGARKNLGYTMKELTTLTPLDFKPEFTPETFAESLRPLREREKEQITFETIHKRKDGTTYEVEVRLQLSTEEVPPVFVAIIQDITKRKHLEEQLRQAQKMEAVGQLTAGVAHDFNNMLAVISGNAELLEDELGKDNPQLAAVFRTTERAANLTQRLLAFSRKQMLNPEVVNANDLIASLTDLLRRTLEEHIDIETVTGSDL